MIRIPLKAVPNQTLAITLARQNVQLALRQNGGALFLDLTSNGAAILRTRICRDRLRILLGAYYRGFTGDLAFVDTQGRTDPQFAGLGSRYVLYYIGADE